MKNKNDMTPRPAPGRKAGQHVHKWRRLTAKELALKNWWCLSCPGSMPELAVWCCGNRDECTAGRCAKHGPKPKRRGVAMPRAFCHDCKGEVIYEPILCEDCASVRAEEGMSREDHRTIKQWRKT